MFLNAKTVAGLDLPADRNDVIYFDDDLAGFGFRMRAGAGGKVLRSWIAQYRRAGRTRRVLLGSASVLGADAARTAAKRCWPPSRSATIHKPIGPIGATKTG